MSSSRYSSGTVSENGYIDLRDLRLPASCLAAAGSSKIPCRFATHRRDPMPPTRIKQEPLARRSLHERKEKPCSHPPPVPEMGRPAPAATPRSVAGTPTKSGPSSRSPRRAIPGRHRLRALQETSTCLLLYAVVFLPR